MAPSALLASSSVFAADKVKRDKRPVALLLPLTGPRAALGLSMRQAVLLADSGPELTAYDTGGTPEGAVLAARNALKAKAAMILGPVTAEELAAVTAQGEIGIDVRVLTVTDGQPLPEAGDAPDAVLLPGSGAAVLAAARNLKATGIQLLGTVQALDHRPASLEALDGAWIASPDPAAFGKFAGEFRSRHGGTPGALAALAYDAGGIVKVLRAKGSLDEAALLAETSYPCVTGNARFRSDGSVARELSILVAGPQGYAPVAVSLGA